MPWNCWPKPPPRAAAAELTLSQISAALRRSRRRHVPDKAAAIQAALRNQQLGQPHVVTSAYAASARARRGGTEIFAPPARPTLPPAWWSPAHPVGQETPGSDEEIYRGEYSLVVTDLDGGEEVGA